MVRTEMVYLQADGLVGAIHRLFQVAFRMKQHEIDLAKKGQDDTSSNGSGDGSSSRKKENAEVSELRVPPLIGVTWIDQHLVLIS